VHSEPAGLVSAGGRNPWPHPAAWWWGGRHVSLLRAPAVLSPAERPFPLASAHFATSAASAAISTQLLSPPRLPPPVANAATCRGGGRSRGGAACGAAPLWPAELRAWSSAGRIRVRVPIIFICWGPSNRRCESSGLQTGGEGSFGVCGITQLVWMLGRTNDSIMLGPATMRAEDYILTGSSCGAAPRREQLHPTCGPAIAPPQAVKAGVRGDLGDSTAGATPHTRPLVKHGQASATMPRPSKASLLTRAPPPASAPPAAGRMRLAGPGLKPPPACRRSRGRLASRLAGPAPPPAASALPRSRVSSRRRGSPASALAA
jgi:hypothetical protein